MNLNTIAGYTITGSKRNQFPAQTLATTTETLFTINTDSGTATAIVTVPQQTDIIGSDPALDPNIPTAHHGMRGQFNSAVTMAGRPGATPAMWTGVPFRLTLSGTATPASNADNGIYFNLYNGTSTSGTKIASTSSSNAMASVTNTYPFYLSATMVFSPGYLVGMFTYYVDGTTAENSTGTALTAATPSAISNLQFCASIIWANAAGGTTQLQEFSLSRL